MCKCLENQTLRLLILVNLFFYYKIIIIIVSFWLTLFLIFFICVCYSPRWEEISLSCRSGRCLISMSILWYLCTILKVLILVYIQISVFQHVRKCYITHILWTLYCCFIMCFNLRSGKLWNKCSFYKMINGVNKSLIACIMIIIFFFLLLGLQHFLLL